MRDTALASPARDFIRPNTTRVLLTPLAHWLKTGDPAATMDRMFKSQHAEDLRLIVAAALTTVLLIFGIGLLLACETQVVSEWSSTTDHGNFWFIIRAMIAAIGVFLSFFVPVLAVSGAILAWAYQVGGARLGVVDLFTCEISTLCRVATVVDMVRKCVIRFEHGPPAEPVRTSAPSAHPFSSQESYFLVFDSNTRDLQTLEARVVINITAFYTYMKAVRDSLRTLAEIATQRADQELPPAKAPAIGPWHEAARNVIYMLFLGLESGRHAITDLVQFEPEQAERTIVVPISELEAYRFLDSQFPDAQDVRGQRIRLRAADYRYVVPMLCGSVETGTNAERAVGVGTGAFGHPSVSQWEPAWLLLPELLRRYVAAIG